MQWLSERPREAVILPCCDDGIELVARHGPALVALGYRPMEGNGEVQLAMLDKLKTYELAQHAGVPTPRHFALEGVADLDAGLEASGVRFPCALKPVHSHLFAFHFGRDTKVLLARNRGELAAACAIVEPFGLKMMVTEIIPGPEGAYHSLHTYLDEHGEPLETLTKRKLRQNPPGFGMGCYHVTDWNEEVAHVGLRFCQGVGIRGMACPEFKRDARDGVLKLIECNHRFTYSNEVLRRAGVNLPLVAYSRSVGRPPPVVNGYRAGVRLWNPVADTQAFLAARRAGQITTRTWLRSLMHRQSLQLFDRDDPRPALATWAERGLSIVRRGA